MSGFEDNDVHTTLVIESHYGYVTNEKEGLRKEDWWRIREDAVHPPPYYLCV